MSFFLPLNKTSEVWNDLLLFAYYCFLLIIFDFGFHFVFPKHFELGHDELVLRSKLMRNCIEASPSISMDFMPDSDLHLSHFLLVILLKPLILSLEISDDKFIFFFTICEFHSFSRLITFLVLEFHNEIFRYFYLRIWVD